MKKQKKNFSAELTSAKATLAAFKRGKREIEERLMRERQTWCNVYSAEGSSSWIFNSIVNKHADIIDAIPTCVCLPREKRDEAVADTLTKIIPVITERAGFEQIYSENAWDKLKHGTAVYGVFWNTALEGGLGDIDVRSLKLSDIFWEPGISDIQDSSALFIVSSAEPTELEVRYPAFEYAENKEADSAVASLLGFSSADGRCTVVDHYYKRYLPGGRAILHLCKFCGDTVLYCSEDDANCSDGWYSHGLYPVVFDRLYPCDDGICGFGLISIAAKAQDYINKIDGNILKYSDWASRVRFWAKRSLGVNEKEFLDLSRSIVEVEGDIDEEKLRQIEMAPLDSSVIDSKRLKIDELKEITGARDVSQGGITGGVTAASAISILREAGAKASRDGIEESYRAYIKVISLIIELIAQFYESSRYFRIVGEMGEKEYVGFTGRFLREFEGYKPHVDIEINAAKKSPSEAKEKNEFARALYESGAFKPERIDETLAMLELMDFDGIGKLKATLNKMRSGEKR